MLILTRVPGERVVIGDDITITVISMSGRQVRLGFEAPPEVSVHREEIYNKIQNETLTNEKIIKAEDRT